MVIYGLKWNKLTDSASFRGISNLNLDTKGRLTMPTRYRDDISDCCDGRMIMTVDLDECLLLYPIEQWLPIEKKIAALPSLDKQSKAIKRILIGFATDVEMDKSGRMLIPPPLRDFAKLDKQIVLIGQGSKFEIWDDLRWQQNTVDCLADKINKDDLIGDLGTLSF